MFKYGDKVRYKNRDVLDEYTFLSYIPEKNRRDASPWTRSQYDCVLISDQGFLNAAVSENLRYPPVPVFEAVKRYRANDKSYSAVFEIQVYAATEKWAVGLAAPGTDKERPWSRRQEMRKFYDEI